MKIQYVYGDATKPQGAGKKIIAHICNNKGLWGVGFVLAISRRWKEPEHNYRKKQRHTLGLVDTISVEDDILVCNMIAQNGFVSQYNRRAVDYEALGDCLRKVNRTAIFNQATIHIPRIGCGLGGGSWPIVESLIEQSCTQQVYVYDLEK